MKIQKLIVIAAIVCLLVGVSGAAMARNDCPDGTLVGGTYDEIEIDEFENCSLVGVLVTGNVLIEGADNISMMGCTVTGELRVTNTVFAFLIRNQVFGGNVEVIGNGSSAVLNNVVNGGSMLVNDDFPAKQEQEVEVTGNEIINGNLRVYGNNRASVNDNMVRRGDITCENNDHLDSFGNNTIGGSENCSSIGLID